MIQQLVMCNDQIQSTILVNSDDFAFIEELELGGYTREDIRK